MKTSELLPELGKLVSAEARQELLEEVRPGVDPAVFERLRQFVEGTGKLLELVEQQRISLGRLGHLLFGPRTEKGPAVGGDPHPPDPKLPAPGHGRRSHRQYTGARRRRIRHPELRPGQPCPGCRRGKLRPQKQPATTVHWSAQPPVGAVVHEMERLRCDTCGEVSTAPTPPEAQAPKFDPSVGVMVGLLRYGSGMPGYRLERLQQSVGVPLPASVAWELSAQTARNLEKVVEHLLRLGAHAAVVYNDDTTMRIGQVRKEIQAEKKPGRSGIFTTGIVCEGVVEKGVRIRILRTGRRHAGENLDCLLEGRNKDQPAPLQMCDALKRNEPAEHPTELCHCLVHARRQFVEIRASFPEECRRVVQGLAEIYKVEAECRREELDPGQRLRRHQERSAPMLEKLRRQFQEEVESRKIEPNSGLGGAVGYLLDRWDTLTKFLKVPGAPLDNNETERLLKAAILHRKNSLHYKTQRGADVGDTFMTVIETCRANGVNPFEYMLAVVKNAEAARRDPGKWMPWNYPQNQDPPEPPPATPA
jgi:hypothetical protein